MFMGSLLEPSAVVRVAFAGGTVDHRASRVKALPAEVDGA
jgi:hypothetical protein